jgi:glutamate dehydrogenase
MTWRQAAMLRAYCKFLLQTGGTFSQAYMEQVLSSNSAIASVLSQLFEAQFDPAMKQPKREAELTRLQAELARLLDAVTSLDEDRILRRFSGAIRATLRTNYYQKDGNDPYKSWLSFKLDPRNVPELPQPRPAFEIFVYSPRVEGVHLRMGHVARGGIRWSDRREDFRTEVLGLMKAQNVKNTVIVPVGAKGGFVPKRLPANASREDVQREGVHELLACLLRPAGVHRIPAAGHPQAQVVDEGALLFCGQLELVGDLVDHVDTEQGQVR